MKILRVITRLNIGGPCLQAQELHRQLSEEGHDCTLIYGQLDRGEEDNFYLPPSPCIIQSPWLLRPISPLKDFCFFIWLIYNLARSSYDIVHTHTAKAGLLARSAVIVANTIRRYLRKKSIQTVHTYHGHVFQGYFSPFMTQRILDIERMLAQKTNALISLSRSQQKEIAHYLHLDPTSLHVVPLGLQLHPYLRLTHQPCHFNSTLGAPHQQWVGWVGRLVDIKKPLRFLEIIHQVLQKRRDIGFVMVGGGPLYDEVKSSLLHRGLSDHVFLLNWQRDLRPIYAGLNLIVNTSDNEGTPVAILEALASGVPALVSEVGGSAEICPAPPFGATFPKENVALAAQHIITLIQQGLRLGDELRSSIVQAHSVSKLALHLNEVYRQCQQPLTKQEDPSNGDANNSL